VIVGDSNMSEYTNFLKVGACAVVLQMIEDNFINQDFTLRNPVKRSRTFLRHDLQAQAAAGQRPRVLPIEIQMEYCEMAQKYIEQYPVSDELRDAVVKWQYVLDSLNDDPDQLDREIDWVIKRRMIRSYIERNDTTWNDPRVFMLDLQYHDLRLNRGLYYLLERGGLVERVLNDDEIIKAKTEPPPDTRARMRGSSSSSHARTRSSTTSTGRTSGSGISSTFA